MAIGNVKSAQRTLRLFETFATAQKPMTVGEISARLEMPQSSTSELLRSLINLGYLEYNSAGRTYYPTPRIALLSAWIHQRHATTGKLPSLVSEVASRTNTSVAVAMRNGIHSQYVFGQLRSRQSSFLVESGHARPLTCCATGWAFLSSESDQDIDKIIRRTIAETDNPHWHKTARLASEGVKQFRELGYAESIGSSSPDRGGIAVLIPGRKRLTPLALVAAGPNASIKQHKDLILETLQDLSLLKSDV